MNWLGANAASTEGMTMKLTVILEATVSLAVSSVAQAALLQGVQGGVWVNRGDGYVTVRGATELKPGDMIMANANGGARLVYQDGCIVDVQPGSVVAVGPESPCATGAISMVVGGLAIAAAAAGAAAAATVGHHTSTPFIPPMPASP
jgi:hypothetical protein